ncbi:unnamed protein product [Blepharisma stoltei]|uniref:Zeta toxin domain-containing protein n=1 Tax=Blepharisma stoltei TaxID=1481888 RepID=A0AAU9ILU5_9CILI|nr:unnamed protein product [Blepharisma stoltei]
MDRISCSVCIDERCQQNNFFIENIYILSDEAFAQVITSHQASRCESHSCCFLGFPPPTSKPFKYNRQQLVGICKFMGIKEDDATFITNQIFTSLSNLIMSKTRIREGHSYQIIQAITLMSSSIDEIVLAAFKVKGYYGDQHLIDFHIACEVISQKRPVIVLLGGASGTGKSTLSSLLASRLGISSLLSTDSIRHILRNVLPRDENQVLFCSTYEAGNFINNQGLSPKEACVKGYLAQCEKVYEYLERVIDSYHKCGISIVIEGVHLHVGVMKKLMQKYDSCIPFTIIIKNKQKHMERFAVRCKYMTIDPVTNKYIASFPNIREIQKRFVTKSDKHLIPKVETSNLDRSFGLCHATIIRVLRQVYKGQRIYDEATEQTSIVHNEFNYVSKVTWSSKLAHEVIRAKVNKGELFKRFFGENVVIEEEDIEMLDNNKSEGSSMEAPDIGSITSGMDIDVAQAKGKDSKEYIKVIEGEELLEEQARDTSEASDTDSNRSVEGENMPVEMLSATLPSSAVSHSRQKSY